MAVSIRETLIAAVTAACATTGLAPVYRSRQAAITRVESPVVIVQPESEGHTVFSDYSERNDLDVAVDIICRGDVPDQLADPLAVALHSAILGDATINDTCQQGQRLSSSYAFNEADLSALVLTVKYRFTYLGSARDISARPLT